MLDWILIILAIIAPISEHFLGLILGLFCNITTIISLLKISDEDKSFKECTIIEKFWRYLYYIPLPILFLNRLIKHPNNTNTKVIWNSLINEINLKIKK